VEHPSNVVGDLEILAGGDHERPDARVVGSDFGVLARRGIVSRIQLDPEERESLRGSATDLWGVLAHPAGEHERVRAVHRRRHRRDLCTEPVDVHVERELGFVIAGLGP